jgi:hypothetical protein
LNRRHIAASILAVAASVLASCEVPSQKLSGTYYGYDSLPNLSPEEDPYAYWFYAVTLVVEGTSVRVTKRPRYLSKGKIIYSASDGGFPVLEGTLKQVGDRTVIALHQVSCDYCGVPLDDPLSVEKEHEYIVLFASGEEFEVDRMRFKRSENPKLAGVRAPNTSLERTRER